MSFLSFSSNTAIYHFLINWKWKNNGIFFLVLWNYAVSFRSLVRVITCDSFCRFWNQLRRRSPTAAVPWLPLATWSPSKPRNESGGGHRQLESRSSFLLLFSAYEGLVICPSCCQYWKDVHSYSMKAKCFVVLFTGVNWYVTMKTSGVLHSILQLVFATYDCSIRKNVTIRLLMHRNALFEAVHNFSSFFIIINLWSFSFQ